jgi:hypothetical protein
MQDIATNRLLGRDTAGTGNVEEISLATGLVFTDAQSFGLAASGVAAASYVATNLTVDSTGRITTASNGATANMSTFLGTPSSANLRTAVSDESGTGALLFQSGDLGTPTAGIVTNLTGTASININGTVGATTPGTGAFTSLAYSTTLTGTSTSASAIAVGRQGATDPVLKVNANTATVTTGVEIIGAAAAGRVQLNAISSGTNEGISINAKGSGTIRFNPTGSGAMEFSRPAQPTSNDGATLGTTSVQWSDLFLANGGVINWNNSTVQIVHTNAAPHLTFRTSSGAGQFDFGNGAAGATVRLLGDAGTFTIAAGAGFASFGFDGAGGLFFNSTGTNGIFSFNGNVGRGTPVTKTTDFTLGVAENWVISNRAATNTVTLPSAATYVGREVYFKTLQAQTLVSASSNVCPNTTNTPGTAILPATAGAWAILVSDGTNWIRMASSTLA